MWQHERLDITLGQLACHKPEECSISSTWAIQLIPYQWVPNVSSMYSHLVLAAML